jgi:hypothetical protein
MFDSSSEASAGPLTALIPRHVLCLVGSELDFDDLVWTLDDVGAGDFSLDRAHFESEPDPRMSHAFRASVMQPASFTDDDRAAVAEHDSVAYVVSPPV